jgi:hypothetical protein
LALEGGTDRRKPEIFPNPLTFLQLLHFSLTFLSMASVISLSHVFSFRSLVNGFFFYKESDTVSKDLHPLRIMEECSISETIFREWNTFPNLIKFAGSEIKLIHEITSLS